MVFMHKTKIAVMENERDSDPKMKSRGPIKLSGRRVLVWMSCKILRADAYFS